MTQMIKNEDREGFESFLAIPSTLLTPILADLFEKSPSPYICKDVNMYDHGYEKGVYWCKPKKYKKASGNTGQMAGFFCAGSRVSKNRIFAFRSPGPFHTTGIVAVAQMYR